MATSYDQLVNKSGTIYNTGTGSGYATPDQLAKDLGISSTQINWSGIKSDPNWSYAAPSTTPAPTTTASPTGVKATSPATNVPPPTNTLPASQTAPYSPPNSGTTGVSQGGIIGNLINMGNQTSPEYQQAQQNVQNILKKKADLETDYGNQNAQIQSRPEGLTQQTGQQGILANLFATKQSALANEYQGATNVLNSANTAFSNRATAEANAGNLNAPQFVTPGQVQVNPSQPGPGQTASGTNIAALVGTRSNPLATMIGTRIGADGKTIEYFNKQTGQGFATPQALADFVNQTLPNTGANASNVFSVISNLSGKQEYFNQQTGQGFSNPQDLANFINQQMPGTNANASNVFDILNQLSQPGNNIVGGNSALNPLSQIDSLASRVLGGQMSWQDALAAGSSIPGFTSALQAAIYKQNPNANLSALEGQSSAISGTTQAQQQQIAQWKSLDQQATTLSSALNQLISSNGINPSDVNAVNSLIQKVASNTSDPNYASFHNLLTEIASVYTGILGQGGNTDLQRSLALGLLPADMNGSALIQVVQNLSAAAQAKIAAINTAPSTYTTPSSTGTSSGGVSTGAFQDGQTAAGGALIFKNGQWVPNQ